MKKLKFDIGIVVPLKEEFRYVVEVAPQLESISHEGTYFYRLDFGAISAVCCLVDQMGPIPALQAAIRLLAFADFKLLVVLGLGGALDGDIAVGDVVIATEVNEFQANSKAESSGESYEVRYSGRHWQLEFRIREALSHFEFSGGNAFVSWQTDTSRDFIKLEIPNKESICPPTPSLHLGPIASGSVVAASSAFVSEVKRINRKFMAIDMEAAGVVPAAAERIHPVPCLVVRGISDQANESKKALDEQGKKGWRRYCVRNATSLLRHLLTWDGFLVATGLRTSESPTDGEDVSSELIARLQWCVGGPWIVGIAFGIYYYGPHLEPGGKVAPMDLSRLRVLDSKVGDLLDVADKQKKELFANADLQLAVDSFASIINEFRSYLNSEDANALLKDFDKVVTEILCPKKEDEQEEAVLLETYRLEEEVGPQAVIELLRGLANGKPRLRARYIDALSSAKMWSEVIKIVEQVDLVQLSRLELEHGLFAYAKTGLFDCAQEMMRQHQNDYNDNAAKLFRREVSRQHPGLGRDSSGEET